MEVVITIGLPGCGKTSWLLDNYGSADHVLVSADRLRHRYCAGSRLPLPGCNADLECAMCCGSAPHIRAPYVVMGDWLSRLFNEKYSGTVLIDTTGATARQREFLYAAAGVGEPGVSLTLALFTAGPRNLPRKPLARRRQLQMKAVWSIYRVMEPLSREELAIADRIVFIHPRKRQKKTA